MAESTTTTKKAVGRPSKAAQEAEMRERLEAEFRERLEGELREKILNEQRAEAEAEKLANSIAADSTPVQGSVLDGDPTAEGAVTIHFVDDGFSALGKVWYVGETLTIVPGTSQWEDATVNVKKGSSEKIMFGLMDEDQQIAKWGKRIFRFGPWRGQPLDKINWDELNDEERAQLVKAQKLHEERYGPVAV
jgi:hypothetical protein